MFRMKNLFVVAGFVSILLLGGRMASAELLNGSFELPALGTNVASSTTVPTSWKAGSNLNHYLLNGTQVTATFGVAAPAPDGHQVMELGTNGVTDITGSRDLWQNTGISLQNGTTYTVSWLGSAEATGTEIARLWAADNSSSLGAMFGSGTLSVAVNSWAPGSASATYTGVSGKFLAVSLGYGGSNTWGGGFDSVVVTATPSHRRSCCWLPP